MAKIFGSHWQEGFNNGYVYYPSLIKTHPDLYFHAENLVHHWGNVNTHYYTSVNLDAMARAEYEKEKNFLEYTFGVPIDYDFDDPNFANDFIKALNMSMQTKDLLEAALIHLQEDSTKWLPSDYFFTETYIKPAINNTKQILVDTLVQSNAIDVTSELILDPQQVSNITKNYVKNTLLPEMLKQFSNIDVLNNEQYNGVKKYQEVYTAIQSFQSAAMENPILNQIYKLYNMDKLGDLLLENIFDLSQFDENNIKSMLNKSNINISANWRKGGNLTEILIGAVTSALTKNCAGIQGNGDFQTKIGLDNNVFGGELGAKADVFLMTENLTIYNPLEKMGKDQRAVSRRRNADIHAKINKILAGLNEGYIVYINAKNYKMNAAASDKNWSFRGFSTGDDIKLKNLREMLLKTPGAIEATGTDPGQLIGQIAQIIPGAIGDHCKQQAIDMIAANVAWFLFDDLEVLGKQASTLPGIQGNQIHLFYLSGFYYPLSVFLKHLAQAFGSVGNVRDYVVVSINTPSRIKYWAKEQLGGGWESGDFQRQRQEALEKITITTHFLRSFKSELNGIYNP